VSKWEASDGLVVEEVMLYAVWCCGGVILLMIRVGVEELWCGRPRANRSFSTRVAVSMPFFPPYESV